MLFRKFRMAKNKRGITLAEMIVAVAITAILASVLSMMIIPVMKIYNANRTKTELAQAASSRLNDIAYHLRGASGIYLSSYAKSFTDISTASDHTVQYGAVRYFEAKYSIALDDWFFRNDPKIKGYLYPEMKVADYSNVSKPKLVYAGDAGMKLQSDDYQSAYISCPSTEDFYLYVRYNPDSNPDPKVYPYGLANVLEIHLNVTKNGVTYRGEKTIVCENLVVNNEVIYTAGFSWNGSEYVRTPATVSTGTDSSKWKKYYSVWFSKRV